MTTTANHQPIGRDGLAEFLYVVAPRPLRDAQTTTERAVRVREWNSGLVPDGEVRDCYVRADNLLAEQASA